MRRKVKGSHGGGGHDGAGMMRWLLTYSDLITLLMAFFVILYAISRVNTAKYASLSTALKIAFNGRPVMVPLSHHQPSSFLERPNPGVQSMSNLLLQLEQAIAAAHLAKQITVTHTSAGITISFQQRVLFASGSADLKSSALPILNNLARVLVIVPNQLEIQGYTDDVPIHTPQFPSNWELSAIRAINVLHVLIADGVVPDRLRATAFGQYHALVPNTTAANRRENRRVDIVVLR